MGQEAPARRIYVVARRKSFGEKVVRQLIAGVLILILILVIASILPDLINNYFQTGLDSIREP